MSSKIGVNVEVTPSFTSTFVKLRSKAEFYNSVVNLIKLLTILSYLFKELSIACSHCFAVLLRFLFTDDGRLFLISFNAD